MRKQKNQKTVTKTNDKKSAPPCQTKFNLLNDEWKDDSKNWL